MSNGLIQYGIPIIANTQADARRLLEAQFGKGNVVTVTQKGYEWWGQRRR
jgi:hypothetical protein